MGTLDCRGALECRVLSAKKEDIFLFLPVTWFRAWTGIPRQGLLRSWHLLTREHCFWHPLQAPAAKRCHGPSNLLVLLKAAQLVDTTVECLEGLHLLADVSLAGPAAPYGADMEADLMLLLPGGVTVAKAGLSLLGAPAQDEASGFLGTSASANKARTGKGAVTPRRRVRAAA
jgi:hypothetical protein